MTPRTADRLGMHLGEPFDGSRIGAGDDAAKLVAPARGGPPPGSMGRRREQPDAAGPAVLVTSIVLAVNPTKCPHIACR
jgi:hypothetical protein